MEFISILLNPKVLAVFGPAGAILVTVCFMLYRFYREERKRSMEAEKKNDDLQEKRLAEVQQMQKDFYELAADLDKTLSAVVKAIRPRNGNGSD